MYAIVEVEKKQYKVEAGSIIEVEKLKAEKRKDSLSKTPPSKVRGGSVCVPKRILLDKVLLISGDNIVIGRPYIKGAKITASVVRDVKSKKVVAFKFKRRKGYHRKVGHRQQLTRLKIEEIKSNSNILKF